MKKLAIGILCLGFFAFLLSGCSTDSNLVSPEEKTVILNSDPMAFSGDNCLVRDISQGEIDAIIHMRIEEKIARDAYIELGGLWNKQIFLNIQVSEQTHMDAVKALIDKYGVTDPLVTDEVGIFPDEYFQNLYDDLMLQGKESVYNAYLVGVSIEELDIKDLDEYLLVVNNKDIVNVFNNLLEGSSNHLDAFNMKISK